jgi:SAM-dependent methyltransferase
MPSRPTQSGLKAFATFTNAEVYRDWSSVRFPKIRQLDHWFGQQKSVMGFCDCCNDVVSLKIVSGATFGDVHNLREGFLCPKGINSRSRLLLRVFNALFDFSSEVSVGLFEDFTRFRYALAEIDQVKVNASIFIDGGHQSGDQVKYSGHDSVFQDITKTSYPDDSFDAVSHGDVLEHVPVFSDALKESYRILKPGGKLLFTAPFFPLTPETQKLAELAPDGSIIHHIDPPEYHGDNVSGAVLAYWRFSWDLLDVMRDAGFSDSRIVVEYDPFSGFLSNNCGYEPGNMTAIAILGIKPSAA